MVFLARNFKKIVNTQAAKRTWQWGIPALLAQFTLNYTFPETILIGNALGILYWIVISNIAGRYQSEAIEYQLRMGYDKHSTGHLIVNGLLFLALNILIPTAAVIIITMILYAIDPALLNTPGIWE